MKRLWFLLFTLMVLTLSAAHLVLADDPEPFSIIIFREADTLTFYLPDKGLESLEGLTIEATAIDGTKLSKRLSDFSAFQGLPFDRIVAPACFQLESNQQTASLPLECRQIPPNQLFTEKLTPADMLWFDSVAQEPRLIFITRDGQNYGQCPATLAECEIVYTPAPRDVVPPTAPPVQNPSIKVVLITGHATVQKSTPFRIGPGAQYEILDVVKGGTYDITGKNAEGSYYRVNYNGKDAWVTAFAQTVVFKIDAAPPASTDTTIALDATLTYGQTVDGSLDRNQKTNYKFIGIAGEVVSITVDGQFDSYLEFHGTDGFTLYEDDNGGGNNNPRMDGFILPANGEYRIVLRGYSARDTGKFRLTLLKGKVPTTDSSDNGIKYGQSVTDALAPNAQVVRLFNGTKGDVISVVVKADFDSYLQIQDANGAMLASDDDSGGDLNPLIDLFMLPDTGQYQIVLRGKSPKSKGTYTLTLLQGIAGDEVNIKYGTTLNDRLESNGRKVFTFEGTAKDRISASVDSQFDARLALRDERGAVVAEDDDSGGNLQPALLDVRLPETGTYFLIVTGNGQDAQGPFTITLTAR